MTDSTEPVLEVIEALKKRGFDYVKRTNNGRVMLHGPLRVLGTEYKISFAFDSHFFETPQVILLEVPDFLKPVAPHIDSNGGLCYLAKGTVVLDIFDPVGQTLACLVRAEQVFEKILNYELVPDLEEEFFALWGGETWCISDIQTPLLGKNHACIIRIGDIVVPVITDDDARTIAKVNSLGWETKNVSIAAFRVRTSIKPRPCLGTWPPETFAEFLTWQSILDVRCRKKIQQRVLDATKISAVGVLIIIESPLLTYGFTIFFKKSKKTFEASRRPSLSQLYSENVIPMKVIRIDDQYLAERNIPGQKTLAGLRIALVGCGTIGGYLADLLVKAGAGTLGGHLKLVDDDDLGPNNLGRHRLGFPNLFKNKARELADELRRQAPGADLRAFAVTVQEVQLGDIDLLIDATGEEALGHWLAATYGHLTTQLAVWIDGPGVAVRTLLKTNSTGACVRCLTAHEKANCYRSVIEQLPVVQAGQGCEGIYVPFPASVSVHSASLGAETALAWANGITTPTLRTRIVDQRFTQATGDCTPKRLLDCPACKR